MKSGRERSPRDFYETPIELAIKAMDRLYEDENLPIDLRGLDAGCGNGIWGVASTILPVNKVIDGIDIELQDIVTCAFYSSVITGNFLEYKSDYAYDIVFGNPPYSLAEEFIRHSFTLLKEGGYIYFLLRLSFLEGIDRGKYLFKNYPPKRVYVCSRRPSFFSTGNRHTTDTLAYAMFLWQEGYEDRPEIDFLDWEYEKWK